MELAADGNMTQMEENGATLSLSLLLEVDLTLDKIGKGGPMREYRRGRTT